MIKFSAQTKLPDHNNPLARLGPVKKIQKMEEEYKRNLLRYPFDVASGIKSYRTLHKSYRRLNAYLKRGKKTGGGYPTGLIQILDIYQKKIGGIHENIINILSLYTDTWLDHESSSEQLRELRYKGTLRRIRLRAKPLWEALGNGRTLEGMSAQDAYKIARIKTKSAGEDVSLKHKDDYDRMLIEHLSKLVKRMFRESHYELRHLFRTELYARVNAQPETVPESSSPRGIVVSFREFVRDCLYGYTPASLRMDAQVYQPRSNNRIYADILSLEKRLRFRRWLMTAVAVPLILLGGLVLKKTGYDEVLWRTLKLAGRDVMSITWIFTKRDTRPSFFEKEILNLNTDVSRDNLRKNLRDFIYGGLYKQDNRYRLFAEHILRDYLILLAKKQVDPGMENEMYRASFLLNPDIVESVEMITYYYNRNIILETDLRNQILKLRRQFINDDVYLFMFLVVYESTPYVFLFSEKIEEKMPLTEENVKSLGIDTFWFDEVDERRLQAYFMMGDNYPFSGKAGFFEGEFAVVFKSLSTKPEWTAWHELGHVVDYMKYTYAGIMVPDNIEVFAVLFPLMFADDPKDYLNKHLLPTIRSKDAKDYYVQSAKGILNGAISYFNEKKGTNVALITNHFEDKSIDWAAETLNTLTDEQLNELAKVMYTYPDRFLATTGKGRYHTVLTNTEEIIYGVHGSPQREVLEIQPLGSLFSPSKGPRFIRDGQGPQDDSAALRRAALIRAVIVFVLFELLAVLLHLIASPVRMLKFHGRKALKIIDQMFKAQPPAASAHKNHQETAKELLYSIYDSSFDKGELFQKKIDLFRLASSNKERFLFHAGLSLAPAIPQRSVIKNEFHLLLFYLPFIGPYLARWHWTFPRQRDFYWREKFNKKIRDLITKSSPKTPMHVLSDQLDRIMRQYEQAEAGAADKDHDIDFLQIESWVLAYLDKVYGHIRLNYEGRWMDLSRLSKAMDRGSEFDRLDIYIPGDDVRQIDWNVTARNTMLNAMVRKRVHDEEVQVAFLFDMTTLDTTANQKKWAADLAKSIRAVGANNHLKTIILLYPDGQHVIRQVKLHSKLHHKRLACKVLAMVRQQWEKSGSRLNISRYKGLKFYSQEENQRYRKQLNWLSYDFMDQQTTLGHLKIRNHTIFMIGVKPQRKKLISHVLNRKNKAVFW